MSGITTNKATTAQTANNLLTLLLIALSLIMPALTLSVTLWTTTRTMIHLLVPWQALSLHDD
jgi:hypothetical protein